MGHHALDAQVRHILQQRSHGAQLFGQKALASHAGIHRHMQGKFLVLQGGQALKMLRFLHAGHGAAPVILHNLLSLGRESRAQNERRGAHAGASQSTSLAHIGHTEERNTVIIQPPRHRLQTVAVRPRLNHRHQFRIGQCLTGNVEIMGYGLQIHAGPGACRTLTTHTPRLYHAPAGLSRFNPLQSRKRSLRNSLAASEILSAQQKFSRCRRNSLCPQGQI